MKINDNISCALKILKPGTVFSSTDTDNKGIYIMTNQVKYDTLINCICLTDGDTLYFNDCAQVIPYLNAEVVLDVNVSQKAMSDNSTPTDNEFLKEANHAEYVINLDMPNGHTYCLASDAELTSANRLIITEIASSNECAKLCASGDNFLAFICDEAKYKNINIHPLHYSGKICATFETKQDN